MIKKISFQNYKAFEYGELELKPITILLGANSVGKSSIINLFLMIQQTASSNNYKSTLRLHGENISMGENENLFRGRDTSKNLCFNFEFISEDLKNFFNQTLFNLFIREISEPLKFIAVVSMEKRTSLREPYNYLYRHEISTKEDFSNLISNTESLYKNMTKNEKSDFTNSYFNKKIKNIINNKNHLGLLYDFVNEIKNIKNNTFSLSFEICNVKSQTENVLKLKRIIFKNANKDLLNINLELNQNNTAYKEVSITSDYAQENLFNKEAQGELLKLIDFNSTLFSWTPNLNKRQRDFLTFTKEDEEYSPITMVISQIIDRYTENIKNQFSPTLINHVSPLRAHPRRYYFLDRANINTSLDTLDGNALTEILKENSKVRDSVNNWLKKFGLHVDVSTLQDVIHKLKVNQHNLDLDITDVGFGISQILPIIVQGFLSVDNSLTMIEQPEIHLHPKMQAELADLFINIVTTSNSTEIFSKKNKRSNKYLLIETHSEYLLKRLRRRISEGTISSKDVAIYFVEPPMKNNLPAQITKKSVAEDGSFEWPRDFYEEELRKDNINFIKQLFNK